MVYTAEHFGRYIPSARPSRGSGRRGAPGVPGWTHNGAQKARPRSPCPNGARSPATSVPWRWQFEAAYDRLGCPAAFASTNLWRLLIRAAVRRAQPHVLGQLRTHAAPLQPRSAVLGAAQPTDLDSRRLMDVFVDASAGVGKPSVRRAQTDISAHAIASGGRRLGARATRRGDGASALRRRSASPRRHVCCRANVFWSQVVPRPHWGIPVGVAAFS